MRKFEGSNLLLLFQKSEKSEHRLKEAVNWGKSLGNHGGRVLLLSGLRQL